jgi:hypothetical protein
MFSHNDALAGLFPSALQVLLFFWCFWSPFQLTGTHHSLTILRLILLALVFLNLYYFHYVSLRVVTLFGKKFILFTLINYWRRNCLGIVIIISQISEVVFYFFRSLFSTTVCILNSKYLHFLLFFPIYLLIFLFLLLQLIMSLLSFCLFVPFLFYYLFIYLYLSLNWLSNYVLITMWIFCILDDLILTRIFLSRLAFHYLFFSIPIFENLSFLFISFSAFNIKIWRLVFLIFLFLFHGHIWLPTLRIYLLPIILYLNLIQFSILFNLLLWLDPFPWFFLSTLLESIIFDILKLSPFLLDQIVVGSSIGLCFLILVSFLILLMTMLRLIIIKFWLVMKSLFPMISFLPISLLGPKLLDFWSLTLY